MDVDVKYSQMNDLISFVKKYPSKNALNLVTCNIHEAIALLANQVNNTLLSRNENYFGLHKITIKSKM